MKDWLERQKIAEKDMLEAVSIQARQVTEDLIPQVRLCALENEMCANITMRVHFEFNEDNSEIWSEGAVEFPPRQSVSQCFEIGYGEDQKESDSRKAGA